RASGSGAAAASGAVWLLVGAAPPAHPPLVCRPTAAGSASAMAVAIVTGANSGIGRATAVALANAGSDVGITWHREEDRAHGTTREIAELGRRCEARHADLRDVSAGARAVDEL